MSLAGKEQYRKAEKLLKKVLQERGELTATEAMHISGIKQRNFGNFLVSFTFYCNVYEYTNEKNQTILGLLLGGKKC
ncbi:hypothetical protein [Treponema sp.]|uniref:hypothetical protein n=1 Tax=Treponema sp. TaxID=166 RepID=UPI0025E6DA3D|nr:hypothetical protein [Treponema sp.]MCR5218607.1 hypothetical protein [Treponema sp.]